LPPQDLTERLKNWNDLTLADLAFAYRKAKVDCFYERALSLAEDFAAYEQNLQTNLEKLFERLQSSATRAELAKDPKLLGTLHLVPKKVSFTEKKPEGDEQRPEGDESSLEVIHAYYSEKGTAFDRIAATKLVAAEFRVASRFSVDFHVLSGLWVNRIGHRFDACLGEHAYGSRLRRYGDDGAPNSGAYQIKALGSMAPYFLPYKTWREHGLSAMKAALEQNEKIVAVTLDIRNFYHRIDPSFILDPRFHEAIGLNKESSGESLSDRGALTSAEEELTRLFLDVLAAWSKQVAELIGDEADAKEDASATPVLAGLPIAVTACRVMANVLLCAWDLEVVDKLSPIYYGRYVDDMFLVLSDPGTFEGPEALFERFSELLTHVKLEKPEPKKDRRCIVLGEYQGQSELVLQDGKHRVFFLEGRAGLDLLDVIQREIIDLSSERRLLPDPDALTRTPAARVLAAAGNVRDHADSLRKSEGLSVRRMSWAIQLGAAETLALDLPADDEEWSKARREFYRFASDHVLRPECLLEHFDYLPRLIGLAVASRDWADAMKLVAASFKALDRIGGACVDNPVGLKLNGYSRASSASAWDLVKRSMRHAVQEAVSRAWPWSVGATKSLPDVPSEETVKFLKSVGIESRDLAGRVRQLVQSDLARSALKTHFDSHGAEGIETAAETGTEKVVDCFRDSPSVAGTPSSQDDVDIIRDFLERLWRQRMKTEVPGGSAGITSRQLVPYVFPTRPYTAREIAEIDTRCVWNGHSSTRTGDPVLAPVVHWGMLVHAIRGSWTKISFDGLLAPARSGGRSVDLLHIGKVVRERQPLLCLANLETRTSSWLSAAEGKPDVSSRRYQQLVRLVNTVLQINPRPHYLLLPELALPRRWVTSVVNRLLNAKISVIAGVEYEQLSKGGVHNNAILALTDDRLGYDSSVLIWQHKSAPAPLEEEGLLRLHGRHLVPPKAPKRVRVYRHHGFDFGVLICSELQSIQYREQFQGEVDSLFILSWNKDLETFSPLIESAALDVHAYIATVNNRTYGDSRVRSPAKKSHERDLCRIRGGVDDYAVVVKLEVLRLRQFQSRAKNWPRDSDPYKPVPQGFIIAPRRREIPDGGSPRSPSEE